MRLCHNFGLNINDVWKNCIIPHGVNQTVSRGRCHTT